MTFITAANQRENSFFSPNASVRLRMFRSWVKITSIMCESIKNDIVNVGDYIVIQRQSYMKLLKVKQNGTIMLGKDQLKLDTIVGKPLWATYKMEPKKSTSKRDFILTECDSAESLAEQFSGSLSSGIDNRNIFDDGNSQQLSTEEIIGMRDSGMSGHEIVGQLIENSKTFRDKTEYSQVKYLKKKEKKYFEYVTIRRPTIRLISQIMYRQDPSKIMGLRMDTLAQLTTAAGITSQGTYILYESGCLGLVAATMLNCLDEGGCLVHAIAGNLPQKQAISSMNFNEAQMSRLISVNIYSLLRKLLQDDNDCTSSKHVISEENGTSDNCVISEGNTVGDNGGIVIGESDFSDPSLLDKVKCDREESSDVADTDKICDKKSLVMEDDNSEVVQDESINRKRKHPDEDESGPKKARWELETKRAADLLRAHPADGLVVIAREHPANIVTALLPFVAPSRPFVVFGLLREPLLELYVQLKCRSDVIGLRLTESWLRTHQILPNRTHPDILMSGGGGYLLSGTVVDGTYLNLNE